MTNKYTYHTKLYLGDSIDAEKLDKLKKMLEENPLFSGIFVIYISNNPSNQLDIIDSRMLTQSYYRKLSLYIVGLAGSHEEAIGLVKTMIEDCMQARKDCFIKEYLLCGK